MSSRMSAKTRATAHLQRMRDATRDIFRNLQQTSKVHNEEERKEMSELLAQNRERLLAVLHIAQTQLGECVAELKSHSAHKARMDELQKDLDHREQALVKYGGGLHKVESMLNNGLAAAGGGASCRRDRVSVPLDDLIQYSHLISYTTSARDGWEPNTPLSNSLPPAPHMSVIAQSRLFPPDRRANKRPAQDMMDEDNTGKGSKADGHRYIRTWKHPLHAVDGDAAGVKAEAPAPPGELVAPPPPKKKAIQIPSLSQQSPPTGKHIGRDQADGESSIMHLQRELNAMPPRPAKWRPGDPITVMSSDMTRPPAATVGGEGGGGL